MSRSSSSTTPGTTSDMNRHYGQDYNTIPRYVQFTSPVSMVSTETNGQGRANTLPLNLIIRIVGYLDDLGDIARVTRTSRLLFYLTQPQLYKHVTLHSYPEIRYVGGRPEGYGSGSPLVMALNGLVTKNHAALVKSLRLWGQFRDLGVDDFEKGRVPDSNMMFNILLRVAVDRMTKLQSFSWELDCKPNKTLYLGLAARETLTSLTIKFSTSRKPRPVVVVPPMPNLRAFRATDIDPLCYPDDISLLLLRATKLEDLRMHFSPRMRAQAESSLQYETYFGRCMQAGYTMKIKHFGMQNWYASNVDKWTSIFDHNSCASVTFIDVFGGATGDPRTAFLDSTWNTVPQDTPDFFTACRTNEMSPTHVEILRRSHGMQRMYWISAKAPRTGWTPDTLDIDPSPPTPEEPSSSVASLGRDYIRVLTQSHGETLRHLLLHDQWALTADEVSTIIRGCPNLEQFGLAIDSSNHSLIRLLMPFLKRLHATRLLYNESLGEHLRQMSHEDRMEQMSRETARATNVEWIGLGKLIYHLGKDYEHTLPNGQIEWRRTVTLETPEAVQHLEIWKYDCFDLMAEPNVVSA